MNSPNEAAFLAGQDDYFAKSLQAFENFGGPCVHFHRECLKQRFLSDDHVEMLYATLTAWGMHRMGKGKCKLTDWPTFQHSIQAQEVELRTFLNRPNFLDKNLQQYEDTIRELRQIYAQLKLSDAGITIVVKSKALYHLLPDLVPPIDRQYTLRFLDQPPHRWKNSKNKFTQIRLPAGQDLFDLFLNTCLRIKRIADQVKPDLFQQQQDLGITAPKAMDNAIIAFIQTYPSNMAGLV